VLAAVAVVAAAAAGGWWLHGRLQRDRGLDLAHQGRFADAEPLLRQAVVRDPSDAEVVKALAAGCLDVNQLTEAEQYCNRWCALRPNDPESYLRRMELWRRLQRIEDALPDARRVVELQPDNDDVHRQVVEWLLMTGRLPEAERECQVCLRRRPGQPELLLLQAGVNHAKGNAAEAARILDQLLQAYPELSAALVLRATLYYEAGEPARAIPLLRAKAVAQDRQVRKRALYYLSLSLARTGQTDEAQRAMAEMQWLEAMEIWNRNDRQNNPGLHLRLAEALVGLGEVDKARQLLDKILRQDPNCAAAHQLLATCDEKQGRPEQAADHRRRAGAAP
jgi:tetratricopeptide (TPR) repeat protein